jgi:hypothetical protein
MLQRTLQIGDHTFIQCGRAGRKIKFQPPKPPSTKIVDITGQRFGRLRVVMRAPSTNSGAARWYCRCDCGNGSLRQPVIVRGDRLRRGETQSCGCLAVEKTLQRAADRPKVEPKPRKPRAKRSQPTVSVGDRRSPVTDTDWRAFKDKALQRALADLDAEAKARG